MASQIRELKLLNHGKNHNLSFTLDLIFVELMSPNDMILLMTLHTEANAYYGSSPKRAGPPQSIDQAQNQLDNNDDELAPGTSVGAPVVEASQMKQVQQSSSTGDDCLETHNLEQRAQHDDNASRDASCEPPIRTRRDSQTETASNLTSVGRYQQRNCNRLKIPSSQQESTNIKQQQQQQLHHHHHNQTMAEQIPTAADYKNAGNKLCAVYRYDEAISCYTKAIEKSPEVPIFYSNRALCHLKLAQYQLAVQDCRRALDLDSNLIKGHLFLGQALAELENLDEALKHLQRAHDLAREKQLNFGDDMTYLIRLTKRRRWNKIEDESSKLEDELHDYLDGLIKEDRERRLKQLSERLRSIKGESSSSQARVEATDGEASVSAGASNEDANLESQKADLNSKCDTYINKLDAMFSNLRLQRKKREVPDHLCGKISFEIMNDPVITPSGITYDRQDIEEHLRRVGHFDPITRQPLTSDQLISNLAMKEVVDAYLSENEWANYF